MRRYKCKVKKIKKINQELKAIYKKCKSCGEVKHISMFYKDKAFKSGYKSKCKQCSESIHKGICENCGKEFTSSKKNQKFCSVECLGISNRKRVEVTCDYCGKKYEMIESLSSANKHRYCSIECKNKGHSMESKGRMINSKIVKCDYCGKEIKKTMSQLKNRRHSFCSTECFHKFQGEYYVGEKHNSWNPNIPNEKREQRRNGKRYEEWKEKVYEKYDKTCQACGSKENIVAHHLSSWTLDKENKFNVDNGICLCKKCHIEFHSIYGHGEDIKENFKKWIKNKKEH